VIVACVATEVADELTVDDDDVVLGVRGGVTGAVVDLGVVVGVGDGDESSVTLTVRLT
jgi:hypothetical protein